MVNCVNWLNAKIAFITLQAHWFWTDLFQHNRPSNHLNLIPWSAVDQPIVDKMALSIINIQSAGISRNCVSCGCHRRPHCFYWSRMFTMELSGKSAIFLWGTVVMWRGKGEGVSHKKNLTPTFDNAHGFYIVMYWKKTDCKKIEQPILPALIWRSKLFTSSVTKKMQLRCIVSRNAICVHQQHGYCSVPVLY